MDLFFIGNHPTMAGAVVNQVLVASRAGAVAAAAPIAATPSNRKQRPAADKPASAKAGPREEGLVKWFNYTKGFEKLIDKDGH